MSVDLGKLTALAGQLRDANRRPPAASGKAWYRITDGAAPGVAEVFIYQSIGEWGITADAFVAEWNAIPAARINLHINSDGGYVFDGIAIYNAVRNHPAHVTSIVDGVAASAASFIALGADEVLVERTARMMIHDAAIGAYYVEGNAAQMREAVADVQGMADLLDDLSNNIASIYADKAGGTVEAWRAEMARDKWYTAEQAVAAGLADGIAGDQPTDRAPVAPVAAGTKGPPETGDVEGIRAALIGAFA